MVAIHCAEVGGEEGDSAEGFGFCGEVLRAGGGFFGARGFEGFFEFLLIGKEGFDFLFDLGGGSVQETGDLMQALGVAFRERGGFKAGDGFDAADSGGDGGLGQDAEEADLAGGPGVGAGAEFHRVAVEFSCSSDLDDAHGVAVFVAEELHDIRTATHFGVGDLGPGYAGIFEDAFVYQFLNVAHLLRSQGGAVEVEGEFFG